MCVSLQPVTSQSLRVRSVILLTKELSHTVEGIACRKGWGIWGRSPVLALKKHTALCGRGFIPTLLKITLTWASSSPCPIPLHWGLPSSPFFSLAQTSPTNDSLGNYKEPQFSAHSQIVTLPKWKGKILISYFRWKIPFFPSPLCKTVFS